MGIKKRVKRRFNAGDYIQCGDEIRLIEFYAGDRGDYHGDPVDNYCYGVGVSTRNCWDRFQSGWFFDNTEIILNGKIEYHWELAQRY